MSLRPRRLARRTAAAAALILWGCSAAPGPSHAGGGPYGGKLPDDTLVEMSTTVLVTKRDVVVALDCKPLAAAIRDNDVAAIDREISRGNAVRLPARVTLYTPPFSSQNPAAEPLVVTDDKYGGVLCTPNGYDVVKS